MGCRELWGAVPGQTLFQVMCDSYRPLQWRTQNSERVQSFVLRQAREDSVVLNPQTRGCCLSLPHNPDLTVTLVD